MSDYLKDLKKGCNRKLPQYPFVESEEYCCKKELCPNCQGKIISYKKGCKDTQDKILKVQCKNCNAIFYIEKEHEGTIDFIKSNLNISCPYCCKITFKIKELSNTENGVKSEDKT